MSKVFGSPTGTTCKRCQAPEIWCRSRGGGSFPGCPNYFKGCRGPGRPRQEDPAPGGVPNEASKVDGEAKIEASEASPEGKATPDPIKVEGGNAALYELVRPHVEATIDRKVREVAGGAIVHEFHDGEGVVKGAIEGTPHPTLDKVLELVRFGFKNILLVGPAGSGKTTLADHVANALGYEKAVHLSVSGGTTESAIIGRSIPNLTGGAPYFESTPSLDTYDADGEGGVILWDEFDGIDPNVALCVNSMTANGHVSTPNPAKRYVKRHPKCIIICAANTWGTGPDAQYVGRNQLDAATLDRFVGATVRVDYDRELEKKLVPEDNIRSLVWGMREKADKNKIRRVCGMRMLLAAAMLWRGGMGLSDIKIRLTEGWKKEELDRVL